MSVRFVSISSVLALLSHQMEQLFKLDKELRQGREEMFTVRTDVQEMENTLKRQELKSQAHPSKMVVKRFLFLF